MKLFSGSVGYFFLFSLFFLNLQTCAPLRHASAGSHRQIQAQSAVSRSPVVIEEEDPYGESVRVLSDAIKRQVNRNAHAGHDLLQSKTEAYAANERMHADNFSQKLEGLGAQLQEAEAAAATAEQQIDGERRRHAAAKKEIAEKATEEMAALEEEEAAAVRQQHLSEAHMTQREKQLKKEQKELKEARKQHKHALQEAEKHKKEIQHIIDKERQAKREEEEAEEAREENLEANSEQTL